ncbi:MAG: 2Fe-2S iron-sulfur cluster binding domain-containing protein, partial [Anderseniella sp.]|nr:2Fe-2S iron-sulfur cluster binding domain-containing protein [Anderseniella sp.]
MTEVFLGSAIFVCIVLLLVAMVLTARAFLMPLRNVMIRVNGRQEIIAQTGNKLLSVLADGGLAIPSACGGAGTCGQCRVQVM